MTCQKCIYYDICLHVRDSGENFEKATELFGCKMFKEKSNFVEIVRCKDCKFCRSIDCFEDTHYFCDYDYKRHIEVKRDDFCNYGERREQICSKLE